MTMLAQGGNIRVSDNKSGVWLNDPGVMVPRLCFVVYKITKKTAIM